MNIITRTFKKPEDFTAFMSIVHAHGGKLLCEQTEVKTAQGIFEGHRYVSISVEIPKNNIRSFEMITSVLISEDDLLNDTW